MRAFKYRGGPETTMERDLSSLASDVYYASTATQLNDPFELKPGVVTQRGKLREWIDSIHRVPWVGKLATEAAQWDDTMRGWGALVPDMLASAGIYSLSRTGLDELLWAHYGYSHMGFCIEYDLDILKRSGGNLQEVAYQEHLPTITTADVWRAFLTPARFDLMRLLERKLFATKSPRWSYEQEMRLITDPGPNPYDFRAVKAVHFGHRCPDSFRTRAMKILAGRELRYFVVEPRAGKF